jgi:dTMP kinase
MARGKFITLEGGEGAGKSTQVALLAAALRGAGRQVLETREPGGSEGAEEIRELLVTGAPERWDAMTEALLHFAARREHLIRTVLPALEAGSWVVSDRFADSTMAYQGYGHGLGAGPIEMLYGLVAGEFQPDLTLILDLPVEQGLRRAEQRRAGGDRYERMDGGFHDRLRQGFLEIARSDPARCVVIDARGPTDRVHAAVRAALLERLGIELP